MPSSLKHKKRGHPIVGDELVRTRFHWYYWCDVCGKYLHDVEAIYRPAGSRGSAGGWCKECARAYDFLNLRPVRSEPGDMDRIDALYHFTDSRNVLSIVENGILNLDDLRARKLNPHMTSTASSRSKDADAHMSRLVRLSLQPHHPMAWKALYDERSPEITWFAIDARVLAGPDTLYSNTNALTSGRTVDLNPRTATRGTDQAEAMVTRVRPSMILRALRSISV